MLKPNTNRSLELPGIPDHDERNFAHLSRGFKSPLLPSPYSQAKFALLARWLKEEREIAFDMRWGAVDWGDEPESSPRFHDVPLNFCGTSACLYGLIGLKVLGRGRIEEVDGYPETGIVFTGLLPHTAMEIFYSRFDATRADAIRMCKRISNGGFAAWLDEDFNPQGVTQLCPSILTRSRRTKSPAT